ncbi:endopeptidase La [candidate division LCP-89 bacterium B3_LCP]|uniref:Lon protease n=1 Tax=candidate division LCP-89 bacterium B3_LCP TaxID=2012998 RepID=A0A532USN7_UNCL8|nr:MAG: endopeptidase La [candidate division LCP-89 bacterium B3_LCP]
MHEENNINTEDLPEILSIIPLRNSVLFPHQIIPLAVGREKSLKLLADIEEQTKYIGVIAQKQGLVDDPNPEDMYSWGTIAAVLKVIDLPDDSKSVIVQGLHRFKVIDFAQLDPYIKVVIERQEDNPSSNLQTEALVLNIRNLVQSISEYVPNLTGEHMMMLANIQDPGRLVDTAVSLLNLDTPQKEEILENIDVSKRLERATFILNEYLQKLEIGSKIQNEVQGEISKSQREYFLREQMKAIHKELGDDQEGVEIAELRERLEEAKLPEDAEKVASKEIDRLSRMPSASAEYTVSRTYVDWLLDIPWNESTEDNLDLKGAEESLDGDHYGLDKVKKRILEYLAVRKLKDNMKGPILCFLGPPGVGKTSLGKSIANALGRKFVRISLGGLRDEAEIRGHRRTYIGALPGRIIQGIKRASTNNPVFMLDEIDKVGMDFRGDPSSALLEVLDPEQNFSFSDHYLDVDFDLSKVMFIATANITDPIPPALKDRMEIQELPGYIEEEKLHIARKFLVPKQIEEHGLSADQIIFHDDALREICRSYTREAGVRNLEREIAAICRNAAKQIAGDEIEKTEINNDQVREVLGPIKFFSEMAERINRPGISTGVAWTATGGDILFVEATRMPGKGNLILTGQLGDVMKESAQAALSYIRSRAKELGIKNVNFEEENIHVHVPAGAIPKDGPSAGVTILTAICSLLTKQLVHSDMAMTGEITLRGAVLPVGGIKEKVLAAHRSGIRRMVMPWKNEKDLEETPQEVREEMEFIFIKEMSEVLTHTLVAGKSS